MNVRDRWLGALCYVSFLVFVPLLSPRKSPFLARHCRQGFALLFVEVIGFLVILIIDSSIGRIPILGFLVAVLLRLILFLAFLVLSAMGFAKALFGEDWPLPFLEEWADRIPIQ
jgi:uncharacterized membrane protein